MKGAGLKDGGLRVALLAVCADPADTIKQWLALGVRLRIPGPADGSIEPSGVRSRGSDATLPPSADGRLQGS